MSITRDQLLGLSIEHGRVTVPELGGEVRIRTLTGEDFDRARKSWQGKGGAVDENGLAARFVVVGVCDDEGKPLFTDRDLDAVNRLPSRVLMRLFRAVQDHNGLGQADAEEAVGNFAPTTPSGSGTA